MGYLHIKELTTYLESHCYCDIPSDPVMGIDSTKVQLKLPNKLSVVVNLYSNTFMKEQVKVVFGRIMTNVNFSIKSCFRPLIEYFLSINNKNFITNIIKWG